MWYPSCRGLLLIVPAAFVMGRSVGDDRGLAGISRDGGDYGGAGILDGCQAEVKARKEGAGQRCKADCR